MTIVNIDSEKYAFNVTDGKWCKISDKLIEDPQELVSAKYWLKKTGASWVRLTKDCKCKTLLLSYDLCVGVSINVDEFHLSYPNKPKLVR